MIHKTPSHHIVSEVIGSPPHSRQGTNSALRVSLSKIRLHGSQETLNTMDAAKKAVATAATATKPRIIRIGGQTPALSTKIATPLPLRSSEPN